MSLTLIQIVLILAPILLGASIVAYWRLRRHVSNTQEPVVVFLQKRWNVLLIVMGGIVLFRGAAISDGVGFVPQLFGFLLSLEFFYIAYATIRVTMSARGLLMGMRYMPWQRFSRYVWRTERDLVLISQRKSYRFRVPAQVKPDVQKILDLDILK